MPIKQEKEVFDVWATGTSCESARALVAPSKRIQKFKDFSNRSMTNIKAVVKPMAGQSINPSLDSHQKVLKKVIQEEEK